MAKEDKVATKEVWVKLYLSGGNELSVERLRGGGDWTMAVGGPGAGGRS